MKWVKFLLLILLSILTFIVGFTLVISKKNVQFQITPNNNVSRVSPTPILLHPPSNATNVTLINTTGIVNRIPWNNNNPVPASSTGTLSQGDTLQTGEGGVAEFLLDSISCVVKDNANVGMRSLLPETMLVHQLSGTMTCNVKQRITFRISGSLLVMEEGSINLSLKDGLGKIEILQGMATLGFVDFQNNTKVWRLQPNDTAVINSQTDTVKTTGVLLQ